MAEVLGLIEKDNGLLDLTERGEKLIEGKVEEAYREGLEKDELYSSIVRKILGQASPSNSTVLKARITDIIKQESDQELKDTSFKMAARDAMKFMDAAGFGEYQRVPGKKSKFEVFRRFIEEESEDSDQTLESDLIENHEVTLKEGGRIIIDRNEDKTIIKLPSSNFELETLSQAVMELREESRGEGN